MLRCTPAVQELLAPGRPTAVTTPKALAGLLVPQPDKHTDCGGGCGGAKPPGLSPAALVAIGALAGAVIILLVKG